MKSATVEQVPVGAFYVGSICEARYGVVQSRRKCKCPDCLVLPFEERGLEVVVGDGVYNYTIHHPRPGSFKTRDQLDQEEAAQ
ncbi:hypothetical protein [Sinomonas sp. G460-2]|uniref:hypothetical protein n=1 Tax=Sinomonas sp. G460-2 TaxID=3393464 RepID=UPI0039F04AE5